MKVFSKFNLYVSIPIYRLPEYYKLKYVGKYTKYLCHIYYNLFTYAVGIKI